MSDIEKAGLEFDFMPDDHQALEEMAEARGQTIEEYLRLSIELGSLIAMRYMENEILGVDTKLLFESPFDESQNTNLPIGSSIIRKAIEYQEIPEQTDVEDAVTVTLGHYERDLLMHGAEQLGLSRRGYFSWCLVMRRIVEDAVLEARSVWITGNDGTDRYQALDAVLSSRNPETNS